MSEIEERKAEVVRRLFDCASAADRLQKMTDAELAKLLEEHVWANMSMLSVESEVVSSAIDRLRRAGGGPLPDEAAKPEAGDEVRDG